MKKKKKISNEPVRKVPVASSAKNIEQHNTQKVSPSKFSLKYQLALLCAVIGFLLYANTLHHGYSGDDGTVTKNNKLVAQGIKAIPEILKTSYRQGYWERKEGLYRPLSVVVFAVEQQLSPDNPSLGHLINVILYALTGFILLLTLSALMQDKSPVIPFIASLLFIVHPVHTEVVANIKSCDEILSMLFTILSFYFLSTYIHKKSKINLLFSGISFLLALLSKESALPCIIIAPMAVWFFSKMFSVKQLVTTLLAYGSATVLYLCIRFAVLGGLTNFQEIAVINNSLAAAPDFMSRIATATMILGKYLLLLFYPYPLSSDYSYNQIPNIGFGNIYALLSLAVYIFLFIYSVRNFKSKNPISFGILFFLLTIALVSNLLFLIESVMAERFLYFPSLGFCFAAAVWLAKLFKTNIYDKNPTAKGLLMNNKALLILITVVAVLFSVKTIARNTDWKDDMTLLKKDVQSSPESARVRYAYGTHIIADLAMKEKDTAAKNAYLDEAIKQLEKSASILNTFADPYYYLGIAYKEKGDYATAIKNFELARQNNFIENADYHLQFGVTYVGAKQLDKAVEEFKQAGVMNPLSYEAFLNLGIYSDELGRFDESVASLKHAIEINPSSYEPYYSLGNVYVHAGKYEEAIDWFKKSASLNEPDGKSYNNIANCYFSIKDYAKAIEYYKKALAIDPKNADVLNNMQVVNKLLGK